MYNSIYADNCTARVEKFRAVATSLKFMTGLAVKSADHIREQVNAAFKKLQDSAAITVDDLIEVLVTRIDYLGVLAKHHATDMSLYSTMLGITEHGPDNEDPLKKYSVHQANHEWANHHGRVETSSKMLNEIADEIAVLCDLSQIHRSYPEMTYTDVNPDYLKHIENAVRVSEEVSEKIIAAGQRLIEMRAALDKY